MAAEEEIPERIEVTETRTIRRLSLKRTFQSMLDAFNLDRGVIFTLRRLFIDPGNAIVAFLGTGRYHYIPPFRILIVTTAIVLYLISFSESAADFERGFAEGGSGSETSLQVQEVLNRLSNYTNLILWTFIPFFALLTYVVNYKRRFNFAEHLVFHTYLFSLANIFGFLMPLDNFLPAELVLVLVYVPMLFYYVFAYRSFLEKGWLRSSIEMMTLFLLSSAVWFLFFSFSLVFAVKLLRAFA